MGTGVGKAGKVVGSGVDVGVGGTAVAVDGDVPPQAINPATSRLKKVATKNFHRWATLNHPRCSLLPVEAFTASGPRGRLLHS